MSTDAEMAGVKRAIDKLNQQRNDLIERLDDFLTAELSAADVRPSPDAGQNTETPGSAIDRLSILALRLYHMEEQAFLADADAAHIAKARARLEILHEQRHDLSASLAELLGDIFAGRKRLKVYHQFKMYNDPTMNPYLYGRRRGYQSKKARKLSMACMAIVKYTEPNLARAIPMAMPSIKMKARSKTPY